MSSLEEFHQVMLNYHLQGQQPMLLAFTFFTASYKSLLFDSPLKHSRDLNVVCHCNLYMFLKSKCYFVFSCQYLSLRRVFYPIVLLILVDDSELILAWGHGLLLLPGECEVPAFRLINVFSDFVSQSCSEPRGFGFVQFLEPDDAAEAKHLMDGQVFQGRQLTVVFAEENRKKPTEMRYRERGSSHRGRVYERRRSPPLYSRSPRYSRSPPSRYARPHTRDYSPSPERREHSRRSISPPRKSLRRERSFSRTPTRQSRSVSRSPVRGNQSPPYDATSPVREHSPARGESRSRSPRDRSVDPLGGDSGEEELNGR